MKRISALQQIVLLLGLGALLFIGFILVSGSNKGNPEDNISNENSFSTLKGTSTVMPPGQERRQKEIERLQTEIADPNINPGTKGMLEKKLELSAKEATLLAKPGKPFHTPRAETPDPTKVFKVEGAFGLINAPIPFSPQFVKIKNIWKGRGDKGIKMVYAGNYTKDPEQGVVIVSHQGSQNDGFYPTPFKVGSVMIKSSNGMVLLLSSETGDLFSFDVTTEEYLDQLTPAPTGIVPNVEATAYP